MTDAIEGGCRCGRIRYRLAVEKLPNAYACHCRDCQTWSGSAFSLQFIVPENALDVTGEPQLYELTSPQSGRTSYQRGCPVCLTRVYTRTARGRGSQRFARERSTAATNSMSWPTSGRSGR